MEEQKDLKRRPEKVYCFIFDDLLGTSASKIRSESKLNNLVHRPQPAQEFRPGYLGAGCGR